MGTAVFAVVTGNPCIHFITLHVVSALTDANAEERDDNRDKVRTDRNGPVTPRTRPVREHDPAVCFHIEAEQ